MKIHIVGIGGIGVSALAQYYLATGHIVSGSDLARSEITDMLRKKGAKIFIGPHNEKNLPDKLDMVVYSPAVPASNQELKEAKKRLRVSRLNGGQASYGFRVLSYPEALGELTKKYFTIAVSGTHGKTTTTAMIALMMIKAGLDPTVIIGAKLKEFGNSNFRFGKSKYLVIEADEWQASFLHYWPKMIVLTNIEKEHLDYYRDSRHISQTYLEYLSHLSAAKGRVIANKDNQWVYRIAQMAHNKYAIPVSWYSISQKQSQAVRKVIQVPGEHNISNALAALTTIRYTKISSKIGLKALSQYHGAWRRFEIKPIIFNKRRLILVSDYGHHPTEIAATLQAARAKWPKKPIWLVFQPHQYQRTLLLFNDFKLIFQAMAADKVIITDIYDVAGRETIRAKAKINSEKLVKAINQPQKVIYAPFNQVINVLRLAEIQRDSVLLVMGAGDIYSLSQKLSD